MPRKLVIGVDIGGSKVALMACDGAGGVIARTRFETPTHLRPDAFLTHLVAELALLAHHAHGALETVGAAGVAVPGPVDPERGIVIDAGALAGWRRLPLRDLLQQRLGVPVFVEHDANAAALGEQWRGRARHLRDFVFIALGTGIGAAVVVDGRLHRGHHFAAGELGHVVVGRKYLGRSELDIGNLASLIGKPALKRQSKRRVGEKLTAPEILERARDAHSDIGALAERLLDHLAIAVVNVAAVLDPEAVVVGGGASAAGTALLEPLRERVARELAHPPRIVRSRLGEHAQLYGAVRGALAVRAAGDGAGVVVDAAGDGAALP